MKIIVVLKMVPDVVEELEVASDGKSLSAEFLRLIVNERDAHALEAALLLKERHGGSVIVVGHEAPEIEEVLFSSLAKGAARAIKVTGGTAEMTARGAALLLAQLLPTIPGVLPADLILTGCQALDDLDGQTAPLLACALNLPYLGLVSRIEAHPAAQKATVAKEYAGGVHGEFEVPLPAVLGIQGAEKPLRYVPVAKVRAAMKSQKLESAAIPACGERSRTTYVEVLQLSKPESTSHAEMLEGTPEELAGKVCEILAGRGLL